MSGERLSQGRTAWADASIVAFDLDGTLAESKSPISRPVAAAIMDLLDIVDVCIISGGSKQQFDNQLLAHLDPSGLLANLHLMPTCGTRYYRWKHSGWHLVYAYDLTAADKQPVVAALVRGAQELGLWHTDGPVWGDLIEDRGSQITYSALGQDAPLDRKLAWDPGGGKRRRLRARVAEMLPQFEVRSGGSTSIDVTRRGVDKAYGIARLLEILAAAPESLHFVGDRLEPGGNDHPVLALGVSSHQVSGPAETLQHIELISSSLRGEAGPNRD